MEPMTNSNGIPYMDLPQIPAEVFDRYEGKWIIWDQDDLCVLGAGDTIEEAEKQADEKNTTHLRRYHHPEWSDFVN